MIKYKKRTQEPDVNFDYALSVLNEANIGLPSVDPKETKCVYHDETLTILLRSCGYNRGLFVLRAATPNSEEPTTLYSGEFEYEPNDQ